MRKFWNTSSGAFETSGNWTPTGVPGEGDLAFITATGSPYTVTTSTDVTVMGVSLSANATLDVTNSKTLTALEGTATGTNLGVIQIEAGSRFIFGGVLNNQKIRSRLPPAPLPIFSCSEIPRLRVAAISFFRITPTTPLGGSIR